MRSIAIVTLVLLAAVASFAADEKPNTPSAPPPPPSSAEKALNKWEANPAWLAAIVRIRDNPRPGQIVAPGITAGVAELFETPPDASERINKVVAAYDAELLQHAAKWELELKALRAEYEAKAIAELPEAKRDEAKKVLDFSHEKWTTGDEREEQFRKEFILHKNEVRDSAKNSSPEQQADATAGLNQWVREQRTKIQKEDENIVEGLRALLAPDEVQRLEQFNRHRKAPQQQTAAEPKKQ